MAPARTAATTVSSSSPAPVRSTTWGAGSSAGQAGDQIVIAPPRRGLHQVEQGGIGAIVGIAVAKVEEPAIGMGERPNDAGEALEQVLEHRLASGCFQRLLDQARSQCRRIGVAQGQPEIGEEQSHATPALGQRPGLR
jgi:hypothetical protein